jgi:hypothetical protein
VFALRVTELLLMNFPQAYEREKLKYKFKKSLSLGENEIFRGIPVFPYYKPLAIILTIFHVLENTINLKWHPKKIVPCFFSDA